MTSVAQSITNAIHDKIMNDVIGPFMEETNARLERLEKDMAELVDLFIKGPGDEEPEHPKKRSKTGMRRRTMAELEATLERIDVIESRIGWVSPAGKKPRSVSIKWGDGGNYGMTLPHFFTNSKIEEGDLLTCTALEDTKARKLVVAREVTIEPRKSKKLF